jgi:hypothetical protein
MDLLVIVEILFTYNNIKNHLIRMYKNYLCICLLDYNLVLILVILVSMIFPCVGFFWMWLLIILNIFLCIF